jgi:hypothetical protein
VATKAGDQNKKEENMKTLEERAREACDTFAQYGYTKTLIALMCELVEDCAKVADLARQEFRNINATNHSERIYKDTGI